jgi:predicted flap endonuclease-1-like 5' DNA nuclease
LALAGWMGHRDRSAVTRRVQKEVAVRTAYRFGRLVVGLVALGLALGWLLLRRRGVGAPPPRLHVVPPLPAGLPDPLADVPTAEVPTAEVPTAEVATTEVPTAELPEEATVLAAGEAAAPDEDDLRQIRGIGPATEAMLHELGINSYQQLAGLDADGRERVRVAVKDTMHRIEREDWVGQATELHRAKYGKDPLRPA